MSPGAAPGKPAPGAEALILVLTTLPDRAAAEALARELLGARLAACIHVGATVQSLYHWNDQVETAEETQLLIKTRRSAYPQLEAAILARHPYELPEIVVVPISHGLPAYLDWIVDATEPPAA
ncbi:MAG TPA: divalent-cation tolerance protein CutA [Casimicrobiaceae bacterium]|nr:divalent-cation tolerance protein CutA [Casimicrobiaceae bacterium]